MWPYLSPKRNANGARNQFYENMREVSPGDIVFSFCDTRIKAIGVVTGDAQTITFSRNQDLVIVPEVRDKLLDAWGIDAGVRVGAFTREQNAYLEYHRVNVFKHPLLHE
jgi:hypothetical protein